MAAKRTKAQREHHLTITTNLYLKKNSQESIAKQLGVSQQQVSKDLQLIFLRWRETQIADTNEAKQRDLARLDLLEQEYWEAWSISKASEKGGDPRFLMGVQKCIEQRGRILGLNAPTQLTTTNSTNSTDFKRRGLSLLLQDAEFREIDD